MTANGATGWGFIGEISSQRLRSYTAGFGAASTCVAGVVMNVLTPYMVNTNEWNWGLKTAWFYVGVGKLDFYNATSALPSSLTLTNRISFRCWHVAVDS